MNAAWRKYWWQPGFAAAFFAIGLPYWEIPYSKVNLPDALMGAGLVLLFAATVLTRFYAGRSLMRVVLVMGAVVPAVVMARVVVDVLRDPTSHNLWPLELIIAMMAGGIVSAAGALLGSAFLRLSGNRTTGGDDGQAG